MHCASKQTKTRVDKELAAPTYTTRHYGSKQNSSRHAVAESYQVRAEGMQIAEQRYEDTPDLMVRAQKALRRLTD